MGRDCRWLLSIYLWLCFSWDFPQCDGMGTQTTEDLPTMPPMAVTFYGQSSQEPNSFPSPTHSGDQVAPFLPHCHRWEDEDGDGQLTGILVYACEDFSRNKLFPLSTSAKIISHSEKYKNKMRTQIKTIKLNSWR